MALMQWLQATALSAWLRESTWGFPLIAALHVLGIAWFGGAVLRGIASGRRWALGFMIATGLVLFYMAPVHCYESWAFRVKMGLLALSLVPRATLACWVGMIFAGRGIAFF
jgi:hypothetical protein